MSDMFQAKHFVTKQPTPQELTAKHADYSHLASEAYAQPLKDYVRCVHHFISAFGSNEQLEQQLTRRDLDTVCAFELYQMKKAYTTTDALNLSTFVQKN